MPYSRLYIFLEGGDDERIFETAFKEEFKEYDHVQFVKHCQMKDEKVDSFIKSINGMGADYIFVCDKDKDCISLSKQKYLDRYSELEEEKMIIVEKEIESWYLAIINSGFKTKYKISEFTNTNSLTKEEYISIMPKAFSSKIDFMIESLKHIDICLGITKNRSLNYFVLKYQITDCL